MVFHPLASSSRIPKLSLHPKAIPPPPPSFAGSPFFFSSPCFPSPGRFVAVPPPAAWHFLRSFLPRIAIDLSRRRRCAAVTKAADVLLRVTDEPLLGPEHTGHFVQPHVAAHCGGDIYSRRKPLFSSFGEHTAVCGSSVRQAVARPRHRQSVCIHNMHVALVCSGPPQKRGHMWLNKVASSCALTMRWCDTRDMQAMAWYGS